MYTFIVLHLWTQILFPLGHHSRLANIRMKALAGRAYFDCLY
jgi:hypothetical protein